MLVVLLRDHLPLCPNSKITTDPRSAMSISTDVGQVLGLVVFERALSGDWNCDAVFVFCGIVVIISTAVQYIFYRTLDKRCLPPEVSICSLCCQKLNRYLLFLTHSDLY